MNEKRRQFLRGITAAGIILPIPAICKTTNLMPVAPLPTPFPIMFNINNRVGDYLSYLTEDNVCESCTTLMELYDLEGNARILDGCATNGEVLLDSKIINTPAQIILHEFTYKIPTQVQQDQYFKSLNKFRNTIGRRS